MRRKHLTWTVAALVAAALALRAYREFVPWGASPQPYLLASRDGPAVTSPDGAVVLRVVFNDAGAAHSGNHWTWFVTHSTLWGRRVVAQGYLGDMVAVGVDGVRAPLPLRWLDDRTLEVEFRTHRRRSTTTTQTFEF
jgi:hypothetical protein